MEKPKKSRHDSISTQAVQLENANAREHPGASQKKGKKRKKIDAEEQGESMEHNETEGGPSKKKRKNRTSFADPREDTQLNTQSRKGAL
jgi:hypothetical protein